MKGHFNWESNKQTIFFRKTEVEMFKCFAEEVCDVPSESQHLLRLEDVLQICQCEGTKRLLFIKGNQLTEWRKK
jgi:hypothetical protein